MRIILSDAWKYLIGGICIVLTCGAFSLGDDVVVKYRKGNCFPLEAINTLWIQGKRGFRRRPRARENLYIVSFVFYIFVMEG